MITLYGWGPLFDCPSPSPYVMKSLIQLQLLGVDFDCAIADLDAVPKHKAPYIMDNGTLIEDSNFIRSYLEEKLGVALDDGLTAEQAAAGWALERMAEGHLNTAMASERWMIDANFYKGPAIFFMDAPEAHRQAVMDEVRAGIRQTNHGQGFGRHSREEQLELADRDIQAIALYLGDKPFLMGDEPTVADAAVSAVLISAATEFFDSPLSGLVRRHETLVAYMKRMTDRFLTNAKWPVPEMA